MENKHSSGAVDKNSGGMSTPLVIVIALVCALVGVAIGHFVPFGGAVGSGALAGKTTLSESELDTALGSYTYKGQTYQVTARDVITYQSTLDAAKNEDGTYNVPSVDGVLSVARSAILEKEAESRGITIGDEDISAYAETMLGTSDIATIASQYGMDEDTVRELVRQSAMMSKLRDEVVTSQAGEAPVAPAEPAEGEQDNATADYAKYITDLAGDQWDASANDGQGGWVAADSSYATALADYQVTNDSATYEAATAAYYVAYQVYAESQSSVSTEWTNFANGIFSDCSINIFSLVA